jgi:hypothetical protein
VVAKPSIHGLVNLVADWSFEGVGEPKARRGSARGRLLVVEITSQGVAALWLVKFAYGSEKCRAECEY